MVRLLSDAILIKLIKSRAQIWMKGLLSPLQSRYKRWSFSSSDELLRNYKDSLCLFAAPKTKTVAKRKKRKKKKSKLEADLVSVNQGEVPEKGSSDILWQLSHTVYFYLFSCRCVELVPIF